nr:MAG TPA: intron associated endonuclease [Caudoviricetes sp.]
MIILFTVYKISNVITGNVYIGVTNNFKRRISSHKYRLNKGNHYSKLMQEDFNLYGLDSFEFDIIEDNIDTFDKATKTESECIMKFNAIENGYNKLINNAGRNSENTTQETLLRQTIANKKTANLPKNKEISRQKFLKLWQDPEYRKKMLERNIGNTFNLGKHLSDEAKKRISESHMGERNPFYGKTHSEETKATLSKISKSRWEDETYRSKQVERIRKVACSEEYRKKQSLASQGRSNKISELDAITIRYRYLCGEKPRFILKDYPKLSDSGLKKICHCNSWKHLPNTKEELYNMLINYQTK